MTAAVIVCLMVAEPGAHTTLADPLMTINDEATAAPATDPAVSLPNSAKSVPATETDAVALPVSPPQPASEEAPRLKLGFAVRGRIDVRFNDADGAGNRETSTHLSFDTAIITARYDLPDIFGAAEYRFYGASFLYSRGSGYEGYPGEVHFPAYAYLGANLSKTDTVIVGIQTVPFDDRYWGSSWYNSLGFVYGLEEVYNPGITYSHSGEKLSFTAGFFPVAGPPGGGLSRDSARYSVNLVKGDAYLPDTSSNAERNMGIGRVSYALAASDQGSLRVTGSAWVSTVYNFDSRENGSRHAFALSLKDDRRPLRYKLLVARQDIDPRNPGRTDLVAVGDYDFSYNIAARGTLAFAEVARPIATGKFPFSLDIYSSYGRVFKEAGFNDTQRINIGAYWNDKATKKIKIWTEALIGRNDPYVGAGQFASGAAQGGDDRWKVSALVMFGYYF